MDRVFKDLECPSPERHPSERHDDVYWWVTLLVFNCLVSMRFRIIRWVTLFVFNGLSSMRSRIYG